LESLFVTIKNTGTAPSAAIALEVMWDSFLTPLEASDGYVLDQNKATWSIPPVAINESVRRQINVRAVIKVGEVVSSFWCTLMRSYGFK
jgi:hypothetical protein